MAWDNGSQVTLTTHKAAKEMGLEPIPGEPLNLMGVGGSQKTKSTVQYKIPLFDTGGRPVEVTAYGTDHIMAPLEAVDSMWMRAVFPEVPTGGLEAASGRVDLLIGLNNYKLFPVEHSRVQDAMLQRSRFGTGWIASGRPPGQGDPATSAEAATGAEEAASAEAATGAEEATSAEAASGRSSQRGSGNWRGRSDLRGSGNWRGRSSQHGSGNWRGRSRQRGSHHGQASKAARQARRAVRGQ